MTETLIELLTRLLDGTAGLLQDHGESFLAALLIVLLGWLLALFVRHFSARLLRALGLDVVCDRLGLRDYLESHQITGRPSIFVGWLFYISILYSALVLAFDRAGVEVAVRFLSTVAGFIPHLIVLLILVVLGMLLSRISGKVATGTAKLIRLPAPEIFGAGARIAVFLLTFVIALDYLGWGSTHILLGGLATILLAGLVGGVLFALCARDATQSLLARGFLLATYKPGQRIRIGSIEGVIIDIDSTVTRLQTAEGMLVMPNRHLHESTVTILNKQGG